VLPQPRLILVNRLRFELGTVAPSEIILDLVQIFRPYPCPRSTLDISASVVCSEVISLKAPLRWEIRIMIWPHDAHRDRRKRPILLSCICV
jgi:hypothetical protein